MLAERDLGATSVELTMPGLCEIDEAASKLTLEGARLPQSILGMTGR
jgi:hypothetical protein